MTKKSNLVYRPVFTDTQILWLANLVDTYRNTAILSGPESILVTEVSLKLKKEEVKARMQTGESYSLVSVEDRIRTARLGTVTFEALGGTHTSSNNTIHTVSDKDKLASMSEYEQELVFLEAEREFIDSEEEYDRRLQEIKSKYGGVTS